MGSAASCCWASSWASSLRCSEHVAQQQRQLQQQQWLAGSLGWPFFPSFAGLVRPSWPRVAAQWSLQGVATLGCLCTALRCAAQFSSSCRLGAVRVCVAGLACPPWPWVVAACFFLGVAALGCLCAALCRASPLAVCRQGSVHVAGLVRSSGTWSARSALSPFFGGRPSLTAWSAGAVGSDACWAPVVRWAVAFCRPCAWWQRVAAAWCLFGVAASGCLCAGPCRASPLLYRCHQGFAWVCPPPRRCAAEAEACWRASVLSACAREHACPD